MGGDLVTPSWKASPPQTIERLVKFRLEPGEVFQVDSPALLEHVEGGHVTLLPPGDVFRCSRGAVQVWSPLYAIYSGAEADHTFGDVNRNPRVIKWPAEASVPKVDQEQAATGGVRCEAYTLEIPVLVNAGATETLYVAIPYRRHTIRIKSKTKTQIELSREIGLVHERFGLEQRRTSPESALAISSVLEFWETTSERLETFRNLGTLAQNALPNTVVPLMGDRLVITATNSDQEDPKSEILLITFWRCLDATTPDGVPSTGAIKAVAGGGGGVVQIVAEDYDRNQLTIQNLGPTTAFVGPVAAVGLATGHQLLTNETLLVGRDGGAHLEWSCITAAGAADIRVIEVS